MIARNYSVYFRNTFQIIMLSDFLHFILFIYFLLSYYVLPTQIRQKL